MFNLLLLSYCQSDRPQVSLQFYCYPLVICPYGKSSSLQEFILGSQKAYLALVACKFLISMYLNYLYLIYFSTLIFIITTSACDAGSSLSFVLDFGRRWTVLHCTIHVLKKCHSLIYLPVEVYVFPRWRSIPSSLDVVAQARLQPIALQLGGTLGSLVSIALT